MSYAIHRDECAVAHAHSLARGRYQHALIDGVEALSGATLRGRAKSYSGRYRDSACNLVARLRENGVLVEECRGPHGKRMLVIG